MFQCVPLCHVSVLACRVLPSFNVCRRVMLVFQCASIALPCQSVNDQWCVPLCHASVSGSSDHLPRRCHVCVSEFACAALPYQCVLSHGVIEMSVFLVCAIM